MPKIPEYRFEIPEAALGLYLFCFNSKSSGMKPSREGLDHICIEPDPPAKKGKDRLIHAVATDSHHLAHVWWVSNPEKDILPDGIILIPRQSASDFLKGKRPKDTRYWIEGPDWTVIGDNGTRMVIPETAGSYPDRWKDYIPSREKLVKETEAIAKSDKRKPIAELGMNWELLGTFGQFCKKYTGYLGLKMVLPATEIDPVLIIPVNIGYRWSDSETPLKVEMEYILNDGITEMEYVLMPLRV